MPLADPHRSFKGAAQHLFRHLHEPYYLLRNPIAQHLLGEQTADVPRLSKEGAARTILQLAVQSGTGFAAAATDSRSRRQYYIFVNACLKQIPIETVADNLRISVRQVYRDRATVCEKIARLMWDNKSRQGHTTTASVELFEFQLERAKAIADCGLTDEGISLCDSLVQHSATRTQRVAAACALAEIAIDTGNYRLAKSTLLGLGVIDLDLSRDASRLLDGRIALAWSRLTWSLGDFDAAGAQLDRAMELADLLLSASDFSGKQFYIEVVLERAGRLSDFGAFRDARKCFDLAMETVPSSGPLKPRLEFLLLRVAHAVSARLPSEDRLDTSARLRVQDDILRLARSRNAPEGIVSALISRAEINVEAGLEDAALEEFKNAVSLADLCSNIRLRTLSRIEAADILLSTRHLAIGEQFLREIEGQLHEGSLTWLYANGVKGAYQMRQCNYADAWASGLVVQAGAGRMQNNRLLAAALRETALAAYYLGRRRDAKERIDESIVIAERAGSLWSLASTYQAAAKIIDDRTYERRAVETTKMARVRSLTPPLDRLALAMSAI